MTRKRFIKLLMAVRFQRNEANNMADMALLIYGSYRVAWNKKYKYTVAIRRTLIKVSNAMRALCEGFRNGAACLNELAYALRRHGLCDFGNRD